MSTPSKLTLSMLNEAVAGGAVAIRAITRLMPAGGPTDKVFPPTYVSRRSSEKDKEKGKPSSVNHGNVTPNIDAEAGGVTMAHAVHTVVLSLAGLRRLRFPAACRRLSRICRGARSRLRVERDAAPLKH